MSKDILSCDHINLYVILTRQSVHTDTLSSQSNAKISEKQRETNVQSEMKHRKHVLDFLLILTDKFDTFLVLF